MGVWPMRLVTARGDVEVAGAVPSRQRILAGDEARREQVVDAELGRIVQAADGNDADADAGPCHRAQGVAQIGEALVRPVHDHRRDEDEHVALGQAEALPQRGLCRRAEDARGEGEADGPRRAGAGARLRCAPASRRNWPASSGPSGAAARRACGRASPRSASARGAGTRPGGAGGVAAGLGAGAVARWQQRPVRAKRSCRTSAVG